MNAIQQSDEFKKWLQSLRDQTAKAKVVVRIKRLANGNMGDAKHFDGISELLIDYRQAIGSMSPRGGTLYSLLCDGDKSNQQRDIDRAKKILAVS